MPFTLYRYCPYCYSQEIFRSRHRGLEAILPLFLFRPVRCGACFQRHYRLLFHRTPRPPASHEAESSDRKRPA